jgi:hypothetical protein
MVAGRQVRQGEPGSPPLQQLPGDFIMKQLSTAVLALAILLGTTNLAFGWGNATHTYYAKQLGVQFGPQNVNEMYGAVLVDEFNLILNVPGQVMYDLSHHYPMAMVAAAQHCDEKSAAFGFASHNDSWGADYTAHHHAITAGDTGYAIIKGDQLAPTIAPILIQILTSANPPVPEPLAEALAYGLAPALGHDLSETAVDLMIKRREDPLVGFQMVLAAQLRSREIPALLCNAYAQTLSDYAGISLDSARSFIVATEGAYRQQMLQYGAAFTLPENRTIQALAQMNAMTAEGYLEFFAADAGFPTDVTVTAAIAEPMIRAAMAAVQTDYRREVMATLAQVGHELQEHGVRSCRRFGKEDGEETASLNVPDKFELRSNYPNPFNPTTNISYQLPADAHVTLKVYNMIGQEVATLVDGMETAGYKSVTFNADGLASGMYLCRIQAGNFTATQKMQLLK